MPKQNESTWEIGAVRELHREFRETVLLRRLTLRPVLIELSENTSTWGRWHRETRTIEISRKLILEHSWFRVVSVLKHEMAHQYVDEVFFLARDRETPHGPSFQKACALLGVPGEFTGAAIDMVETDLDWRTEKRDDLTEKMRDRVRKLLSLATSNNEHEAALAMNRVREIYAKYNLDGVATNDFVHLVISTGSKRMELFEKKIASILIGHFFVEVVLSAEYDARTGDHHRALTLIGRKENVLMAEYVYHFLRNQSASLVDALPGRGGDRVTRKSFRLGILEGFREKLIAAEAPPVVVKAETVNPISRALVTFKKDRELKQYLRILYPRLRSSSSSSQRVNGTAYAAGKKAGGQISLNRPVSGGGGFSLGRMLGGRSGR